MLTERENLRNACLDALKVIESQSGFNPQVARLAAQVRTVIEQQSLRKSSSGLRAVAAEIKRWARERGGETVTRVEESSAPTHSLKERPSQVESAVSRGRINKKSEYEALLSRVEEIYPNPSEQETVRMLNQLLADYVQRRLTK